MSRQKAKAIFSQKAQQFAFHEENNVTIEFQGKYKQYLELEWEPINELIKDN